MTKKEILQAIEEGLEQHYGRDKEVGCYTYNGAWLSIQNILDIIEDVLKYDVYLPEVKEEEAQTNEE